MQYLTFSHFQYCKYSHVPDISNAGHDISSGKMITIVFDASSTPQSAANILLNLGSNVDASIGPALRQQMEIVNITFRDFDYFR